MLQSAHLKGFLRKLLVLEWLLLLAGMFVVLARAGAKKYSTDYYPSSAHYALAPIKSSLPEFRSFKQDTSGSSCVGMVCLRMLGKKHKKEKDHHGVTADEEAPVIFETAEEIAPSHKKHAHPMLVDYAPMRVSYLPEKYYSPMKGWHDFHHKDVSPPMKHMMGSITQPINEPVAHHKKQPMVHHKKQPMVHHKKQPMVHHKKQPMAHHKKEPMVQHKKQPMVHHKKEPMVHHKKQPMAHHKEEPVVFGEKFHECLGKGCYRTLSRRKKLFEGGPSYPPPIVIKLPAYQHAQPHLLHNAFGPDEFQYNGGFDSPHNMEEYLFRNDGGSYPQQPHSTHKDYGPDEIQYDGGYDSPYNTGEYVSQSYGGVYGSPHTVRGVGRNYGAIYDDFRNTPVTPEVMQRDMNKNGGYSFQDNGGVYGSPRTVPGSGPIYGPIYDPLRNTPVARNRMPGHMEYANPVRYGSYGNIESRQDTGNYEGYGQVNRDEYRAPRDDSYNERRRDIDTQTDRYKNIRGIYNNVPRHGYEKTQTAYHAQRENKFSNDDKNAKAQNGYREPEDDSYEHFREKYDDYTPQHEESGESSIVSSSYGYDHGQRHLKIKKKKDEFVIHKKLTPIMTKGEAFPDEHLHSFAPHLRHEDAVQVPSGFFQEHPYPSSDRRHYGHSDEQIPVYHGHGAPFMRGPSYNGLQSTGPYALNRQFPTPAAEQYQYPAPGPYEIPRDMPTSPFMEQYDGRLGENVGVDYAHGHCKGKECYRGLRKKEPLHEPAITYYYPTEMQSFPPETYPQPSRRHEDKFVGVPPPPDPCRGKGCKRLLGKRKKDLGVVGKQLHAGNHVVYPTPVEHADYIEPLLPQSKHVNPPPPPPLQAVKDGYYAPSPLAHDYPHPAFYQDHYPHPASHDHYPDPTYHDQIEPTAHHHHYLESTSHYHEGPESTSHYHEGPESTSHNQEEPGSTPDYHHPQPSSFHRAPDFSKRNSPPAPPTSPSEYSPAEWWVPQQSKKKGNYVPVCSKGSKGCLGP